MRRAQALSLLVPAGAVTDQDGMRAWRDLCADLLQVLIHRLGIEGRHHNGRANTTFVADRAQQVDRVVAIVAHHRRARINGAANILQ